ncbi:hypothetical protein SAMN05216302_101161 [Nitrosomonas aestuarii]|uniref:Uncharacterized protein n=1 Tax=Nitrosomonas aestuarii TaxID=52441 RepID=A0A1I4B7C0_9PROT|nr:hypothetical protein [Nitrosomonas aestuarii]SFK64423.1 hypothetical protein SAMN05216302_101161 [Nitrosomonas aestuarii]
MSNFTEGPWLILQLPGEVFNTNIESASGKAIAECYVNAEHGLAAGIKETKANAKLIAAAPDLYEALLLAVAFITGSDEKKDYLETISVIESAIKKVNNDE